eukprot:s241_g27.t2
MNSLLVGTWSLISSEEVLSRARRVSQRIQGFLEQSDDGSLSVEELSLLGLKKRVEGLVPSLNFLLAQTLKRDSCVVQNTQDLLFDVCSFVERCCPDKSGSVWEAQIVQLEHWPPTAMAGWRPFLAVASIVVLFFGPRRLAAASLAPLPGHVLTRVPVAPSGLKTESAPQIGDQQDLRPQEREDQGQERNRAPRRAAGPEVDIYFGSGTFYRLQHELVMKEALELGRREGDITALAGYAGGKKAGPLERCLERQLGCRGLHTMSAFHGAFSVKSALIGEGNEPDTFGTDTVYVYDSRRFPWRPAETSNQFRDDPPVYYDRDYKEIYEKQKKLGRLWLYLADHCDHAEVANFDSELLDHYLNELEFACLSVTMAVNVLHAAEDVRMGVVDGRSSGPALTSLLSASQRIQDCH